MFSARFRSKTNKVCEKIAKGFVKAGFTANSVTVLSLIFALITALLIFLNQWLLAGIFVFLTGSLDSIDGAVARITNTASKLGSYLDAITDRYVELIILFALAFATNFWAVVFLVLFGSLLTSYAKARTALETKIDNTNWPDLMERGERIFFLVIAIILFAFLPFPILGQNILFWFLVLIAILTNFTAIQRIHRAKKLIEKAKN